MKGNIVICLGMLVLFLSACNNNNSSDDSAASSGPVTSIVDNKFTDKAKEGIGYYAVGENNEWTLEIDFEKSFVFNHPGDGISVNKPIADIGIDQRGDKGRVFTIHTEYGVIEVNNIYQSCGNDTRSYHVRLIINPEHPKPTIYKGCAFNLK